MGVVSIVGKIILVVVNILTLLLSLAMIAVGVIIVAGKDLYKSLLDSIKDDLESAANDLNANVNADDLSLTDFLTPVAYAFIAIGILVGALSLIGCIGACYTIKIVLIVYVIGTGCLFLAQLIIVILVYADKSAFDSTVKSQLKDTLDSYSGIEDSSVKGLAWNGLMNYEKCCGVDSYRDFANLDNWPPTQIGGTTLTGTLETPVICCKVKTNDYSCAEQGTASSANNYYETGCYDKLWDRFTTNELVLIVIVCLLIFQFVLIFFSVWILCTMDNKIDII